MIFIFQCGDFKKISTETAQQTGPPTFTEVFSSSQFNEWKNYKTCWCGGIASTEEKWKYQPI